MQAQGEQTSQVALSKWGKDLIAVHRGDMTFDYLVKRHRAYVTCLVKQWEDKCPPYMSRDDFRQEIWATVAEALQTYDANHPKKIPVPAWIGWRVRMRMLRLAEKTRRSNPAVNAGRYMDYLIVEERVVAKSAGDRDEGIYEHVTQPSWEAEYDAYQLMIAAVSAMPNARSSNLVAKVFAGALVKEAAPALFAKCRRPNKAAHRAIAQARAVVDSVSTQTLAQTEPENDNTESQQDHQLRPIVKVRRSEARTRTQANAAG